MQANRGRDTEPELRLRRLLHAQGLRYRVDYRPEPLLNRRADIVFRGARLAIFVHGCFWHGCPAHFSAPKANATYWSEKIERNQRRDADTLARLQASGWRCLVVWEHEDPHDAAAAVLALVGRS